MTTTRFAPSPTGLLHLGNIRTALFSALLAKRDQGQFILRIEDTDPERSKEEFFYGIMEDLRWLGLDWQQGPEIKGPHHPYHQVQRLDIYDKYYKILQEKELAYPCYCSEKELELARKAQQSAGLPPRYSGTCAHLSEEQRARKEAQGIKPTLRFRIPKDEDVIFKDIVVGNKRYKTNDIGDFIIRRSNGIPAFFFCNAVDDSLMQVTYVLRGIDHLDNTPRQMMILQALDLPIPEYGHISLIVNESGKPLSKRDGAFSIRDFAKLGYFPQAINNHLARLGHYYANDGFLTLEQLASEFTFEHLSNAAAKHDIKQMNHWQKLAVLQTDKETLWQWMGAAVHAMVPDNKKTAFVDTVKDNIALPQDALAFAKIFFDIPEQEAGTAEILENAGGEFFEKAIEIIQQDGLDWKNLTQKLKEATGKKGKALFMPLRVALTGQAHGPELAPMLLLIGQEKAIARLQVYC